MTLRNGALSLVTIRLCLDGRTACDEQICLRFVQQLWKLRFREATVDTAIQYSVRGVAGRDIYKE